MAGRVRRACLAGAAAMVVVVVVVVVERGVHAISILTCSVLALHFVAGGTSCIVNSFTLAFLHAHDLAAASTTYLI